MKVIFLDIDGVLINRAALKKGYAQVDEMCVNVLNDLIERTGALIVVSSCWRISREMMEIKDLLQEWKVKGKVLGRTPFNGTFAQERGIEIQQWLDKYSSRDEVESFVILDDDRDMVHLLPFLVHTNMETGLTKEHAQQAEKDLEQW